MAAPQARTFFSQWDPMPSFAAQPADPALEQRISKLAEFAVKNGPPFVDMIREKQQRNAQYAFLAGGTGSEYFYWKLYCNLYELNPDQPLQLSRGQPAPHQAPAGQERAPYQSQSRLIGSQLDPLQALEAAARSLPPEVDADFAAVLAKLSGTRTSIKESKERFMTWSNYAEGLAARMALHQQQLPSYEQQLHVIYLANDVLLKSIVPREDGAGQGSSSVASAFQAALPVMLHAAFRAGNSSGEVHQRLSTILDHWEGREVFPSPIIAELKQAIVEGPNVAGGQHQAQDAAPPTAEAADHGPHAQMWDQQASVQPEQPWQPMVGSMPPNMAPSSYRPSHDPYMHAAPGPAPPPGGPGGWEGPPPQNPPQAFFAPPGHGFDHSGNQPGYPPPRQPGFEPPQGHSFPHPAQPVFVPHGQPGFAPPGPRFGQPGFMPPAQPVMPPVPPGIPPAQQSVPPAFPPGQGPMPGWNAAPPNVFPARGPLLPNVTALQTPPVDQQPTVPTDPMGFPPGLIPELVAENLRTEDPYTPLSKRDIERAGIPDMKPPDAYLQARLSKFYAEVQDYRPGSSKADLEDDQKRQKTRDALGGESSTRNPSKPSKATIDDGSYKGGSRDAPAGLGFGSSEENDIQDPFSQYRKQRSGYYHEAITRATTTATETQPVR